VKLIDRSAVIDDVMAAWAPALGAARSSYRGHAYRVYNFARAIFGSGRCDDALAVASAFHDLGIWSDGTFDYIAPSAQRAVDFVAAERPDVPAQLVRDAIENHHRLRPVREGNEPAVIEAFRRADLADVSLGVLRGGLDAGFVREVVAAFPFAGFHGVLAKVAAGWIVRHPLRPLPMMRF
jgi:hypothetical protein